MPHRAHGQATSIASPPRARRGLPRMGLRMRVWAGALALDRRLAEGVGPANSPELELRARQLLGARSRRALSRALTTAVDVARQPTRGAGAGAIPLATPGIIREELPKVQSLDLLMVGVECLPGRACGE